MLDTEAWWSEACWKDRKPNKQVCKNNALGLDPDQDLGTTKVEIPPHILDKTVHTGSGFGEL